MTNNDVEEVLPGVMPIPDDIIELFDGEEPTIKSAGVRSSGWK
jgi:hypothetical protein